MKSLPDHRGGGGGRLSTTTDLGIAKNWRGRGRDVLEQRKGGVGQSGTQKFVY